MADSNGLVACQSALQMTLTQLSSGSFSERGFRLGFLYAVYSISFSFWQIEAKRGKNIPNKMNTENNGSLRHFFYSAFMFWNVSTPLPFTSNEQKIIISYLLYELKFLAGNYEVSSFFFSFINFSGFWHWQIIFTGQLWTRNCHHSRLNSSSSSCCYSHSSFSTVSRFPWKEHRHIRSLFSCYSFVLLLPARVSIENF